MKSFLFPSLVLAFLAAGPLQASAADRSHDDHRQAGSHGGGSAGQSSRNVSHGASNVQHNTHGAPLTYGTHHHLTSHNASHHVTNHQTHHVTVHHAARGHRSVHLSAGTQGAHHYDVRRYHRNFTATRRFHAAIYVRPRGWYYRRWTYGQFFPRAFWTSNYWIADFGIYGLIAPPYDCQWVRYGDDALLVDIDTGEILQVVYGLYY